MTSETNEIKFKRIRTSSVLVEFWIVCDGNKPIVW